MRECITGILGPGTTAIDAHFATTSFMKRIKVFWRMQEDGPLIGSFKQKYSRRVAHGAYGEYLEKLQDLAGMRDEMWDRTIYA